MWTSHPELSAQRHTTQLPFASHSHSQPCSSGFLSPGNNTMVPHSPPQKVKPKPPPLKSFVGYIHLLTVCLILGHLPPSLTVWTLMPPSATPRGSSAHPSPLCPALHLPSPPSDSHPRMHDPQGWPISSISEECFWVFFLDVFGFVFVWSRALLTLRCSDRPPLGSMPQPPNG